MGASGSIVIPIGQVRGLVAELADLQSQIDGISVGATAWGAITGTLSNQTDLQSALDAKLATGLAVLLAGSYSNPSWLTSISGAIVSGSISGNAAGLSATLAIASGGTGQTTANTALNALLPAQATHSGKALVTDGTNTAWTAIGGSGTVTSVGLTAPSQFAVTGSPVTASGTLAVAWNNQAINVVLAGPASGGAGAPTFRSLVAADIPTLTAAKVSDFGTAVDTQIATMSGSRVVGCGIGATDTVTVGNTSGSKPFIVVSVDDGQVEVANAELLVSGGNCSVTGTLSALALSDDLITANWLHRQFFGA